MSESKTKIRARNLRSAGAAEKSKDVHFLTRNLPRQIESVIPDLPYEHMITYGEYLVLFMETFFKENFVKEFMDPDKNLFFEKDSLVSGIKTLEDTITNDVKIKVYIPDDDESDFRVEIRQPSPVYQSTIFQMHMEYSDLEIPDNLKIGIAKAYQEISCLFDVEMDPNYCFERLFPYGADGEESDFVQERIEEEPDIFQEVTDLKQTYLKYFSTHESLLEKEFNQGDLPEEKYRSVFQAILHILNLDTSGFSEYFMSYHDVETYEGEGVLFLSEVFVPTITNSALGEEFAEQHFSFLSDMGGQSGQEYFASKYIIGKGVLEHMGAKEMQELQELEDCIITLFSFIYSNLQR